MPSVGGLVTSRHTQVSASLLRAHKERPVAHMHGCMAHAISLHALHTCMSTTASREERPAWEALLPAVRSRRGVSAEAGQQRPQIKPILRYVKRDRKH